MSVENGEPGPDGRWYHEGGTPATDEEAAAVIWGNEPLGRVDHPQSSCVGCGHRSDCATHNEPALPAGLCDCGKVESVLDVEGIAEKERSVEGLLAVVELMRTRFITAAGGKPPTDEQREGVRLIGEAVVNLAALIEIRVPDGRNKSLALTALEDVQMRANRGIFADAK